ncbi:heme oxygenase (biliverdin-producing) [Longispora albida]|uniref:biliverdin-producing heme oxygenase n=1 Tax=Longispora albida TaxID=203523 RepID=UPI0003707EB3|nr:biliverdin-producing heme oxygenase [Longispora albida]
MFSADLRAATWSDHQKAESTAYLEALMRGQLSLGQYAEMVAQHYFAYVVLEEAAAVMRRDPVASVFAVPELDRLPALEADLAYLLGDGWAGQITASASTERYCARLREVCFGWPGGFVAHHYTRYLGDLSGGQFIRKSVARTYGLTTGGVAFYDFPEIGDLKAFKIQYRDALDAAPWTAEEQQRIITETALAYELNTDVLAELGTGLPGSDLAA